MERDGVGLGKPGPGPGPDTAAAQSKSRFTSPLVINSASRRRSLFSQPRTKKDDNVRPTSSGALSDTRAASPNNTKIPRPASQRRPFSISDAYRMAEEEEEVAQASPSPAPRLWRSRREPGEKRASKIGRPGSSGLNRKSLDSAREDGHDNLSLRSQQSDVSDSTFDEKLRQHALDNTSPDEPARRSNGLFSGSKLGTKIVETGKGLVRKTSRGSLDGSSPRATRTTANGTWLSRRFSGRKRESGDASSIGAAADWAQADDRPHDEFPHLSTTPTTRPPTTLPYSQTPNRSFAWEADADFTAGDLQVSNSPPVAITRSNTKIEEIRALEAEVNGRSSESPQRWARNTRIDGLRALEADAAPEVPDEPRESIEATASAQEAKPEGEDPVPRSRSLSRTSIRMEEARSREIERLSRRALATARLDELRERNVQSTSRSPSPDVARKPSNEPLRSFSPLRDRLRRRESGGQAAVAQAQQAPSHQSPLAPALPDHVSTNAVGAGNDQGTDENGELQRRTSETVDEPRDVLRRLAVNASTSPTTEPPLNPDSEPLTARAIGAGEGTRQKRRIGGAKIDVKPTVGFAGLPKERSTSAESRLTKRASFAHSDIDPTERIEGEMNLFAPMENQSERGSLRAPSPEPEGDAFDATPRPIKVDPLTQPTPRVTGAFVETPATVKIEKFENPTTTLATEERAPEPQTNGLGPPSTDDSADSKPSLPRGGKNGVAARQQKRTQSTGGDRLLARSSSLSARRRARSLSRSRSPLINSARLPTVKDDLLEIQRANHIEDSTVETLDDIADLLGHQVYADSDLDSLEVKAENGSDDKLDLKKELEAYDRMSRSLKTGLLGIRSAKLGIERLEGRVLHADAKESSHAAHGDGTGTAPPSCPACDGGQPGTQSTTTYVHLPLPKLWHRRPKFKFTFLGLTLFLLSLWYLAESWMCFLYCKPQYCYPGTPCDWSPDDPAWGYAIPVKLDQWAAGGQGRALVRRITPDVADWLADLWDDATGTDITTVDTSRYSWEQKRQHRRRLLKKGLVKPFVERPEDRDKFNAWKAVRQAQEEAQAAQEMGYDMEEEVDIIADDERL